MNPKTIQLKGGGQRKERPANAAITPGMLLEVINDSSTAKVDVHGVVGGNAVPMFALEYDVIGRGIDTAYAADEDCMHLYPDRGSEIYGLLEFGETEDAVVVGDPLESAGDGTLRKHTAQAVDEGGAATFTAYSSPIVAYALETIDNSAGTVNERIRVEVV